MDLLVEKISKESGVDKGEVEKKILEKQEEFLQKALETEFRGV